MKAIYYTKKAGTNIVRLIYAACTNDLIVNSKLASIIEDFLLAFCIEFNRLFIADSLLMNALQKHLIVKMKEYWNSKNNLYNIILTENKNTVLEFFNTHNTFRILDKLRLFEKSNSIG